MKNYNTIQKNSWKIAVITLLLSGERFKQLPGFKKIVTLAYASGRGSQRTIAGNESQFLLLVL
jgi:hypothetical protein